MNSIAIYPYKEDPEIRKMRVQAWFRAVSLESGLTSRELEKKFSESETEKKVKRSCVWNKYRRGEVVPRSGLQPEGGLNLVDRVEATYPGTAKWLTLPLWRLLDKAPMEMSEVRRCYEALPSERRTIFIYKEAQASKIFWRRQVDAEDAANILLRYGDIDGLTAVLAMLREAEVTQDQEQHQMCLRKGLEYISRLNLQCNFGVSFLGLAKYLAHRAATAGYFFDAGMEGA